MRTKAVTAPPAAAARPTSSRAVLSPSVQAATVEASARHAERVLREFDVIDHLPVTDEWKERRRSSTASAKTAEQRMAASRCVFVRALGREDAQKPVERPAIRLRPEMMGQRQSRPSRTAVKTTALVRP